MCNCKFSVRPCEVKKILTCRKESCRKEIQLGKNNPNFRHGLSDSDRSNKIYVDWRNLVFKRDKYTCCYCGKVGGNLNAHHIKPWAYFKDDRYNLSNGITMCEPCHRKTYKNTFKIRKQNDITTKAK
jgi:hypothetical protein